MMKANLISNTDGIVADKHVNKTLAGFMWFAPKKTDEKKDGKK